MFVPEEDGVREYIYWFQSVTNRQAKPWKHYFSNRATCVVVDSGNERFFQLAFVPTDRKRRDETFSRTFWAHIPSSRPPPNRHWHSSSFPPPRKHRRMRVIIMHTFFFPLFLRVPSVAAVVLAAHPLSGSLPHNALYPISLLFKVFCRPPYIGILTRIYSSPYLCVYTWSTGIWPAFWIGRTGRAQAGKPEGECIWKRGSRG